MKIKPLTLMILLTASTTSSMSWGDDKKPEVEEAPVTLKQNKINVEELADIVETRYKNLIALSNQFSKINIMKYPPSGKTVIDQYERHENGATVKEITTLSPEIFLKRSITIPSVESIKYDSELFKKGIVASIDYDVDFSSFIENAKVSDKTKPLLQSLLTNLTYHTDLLTDDNVKSITKIKPFNVVIPSLNKEKRTVNFEGLDAQYTFNEKDIVNYIGSGKWTINLKPIEIKSENSENDESLITLQALNVDRSLTTAGNINLNVSPIKIHIINGENTTIDIDGITKKGEKLKFDPNFNGYLGEVSGKVGHISITTPEAQGTIFNGIDFSHHALKNDQGNYDLSENVDLNFNGNFFQNSLDFPLLLKTFSTKINIANISPELFEISKKITQAKKIEDVKEAEKSISQSLNAYVSNLKLNKTHIDGVMTLKTDKGDANLNFYLSPRADEVDTHIDWKNLVENVRENPIMILAALQENIDLKLDISINRDILKAFNVLEFIEEQDDMIESKDGILSIHIVNDSNGLKINGNPVQ